MFLAPSSPKKERIVIRETEGAEPTLTTKRSHKKEGSAPLKRSVGSNQSKFVMVDNDVTVKQLISSRMFVCLSEQRMNKPGIK